MSEELKRLQKIIAERGYCSRRKAEELILSGRVKVDGKIVDSMGVKCSSAAEIAIDGISLAHLMTLDHIYLLMNKPIGVLTTMSDDRGRKTVRDLIPAKYGRVFPVGRLDLNTSGLLILTDDGEFANLVMHPSSQLEKTYQAKIVGQLSQREVETLKNGVKLEDGITAPAKVAIEFSSQEFSVVSLTIHEGKKREVRRMFEALDHRVLALSRTRIGPILLNLGRGQISMAKADDIDSIVDICNRNRAANSFKKS